MDKSVSVVRFQRFFVQKIIYFLIIAFFSLKNAFEFLNGKQAHYIC